MKRQHIESDLNNSGESIRASVADKMDSVGVRDLSEAVAVGVVVQDPDGIIVHANRTAREILRMSTEDALGRTSADPVWDATREDGTPLSGEEHPSIIALRTGKPVIDFVMCIFSHDPKESKWILVDAVPIIDEVTGKARFAVSTFVDMSQWKIAERDLCDAERRMQEIIDSAPYGCHAYELLPDGRLILTGVNASSSRILGVDCVPLVGMTVEEAFPALVGTELPDIYRRVAATGERWEQEEVHYDHSGILGVFQVIAFQSAPNRAAVFFRDITERIRMEEARRRIEKHAEEQNRQFYRETILSVTDGKLEICEAANLQSCITDAEATLEVHTAYAVGPARRQMEAFCRNAGLEGRRLEQFIIGVGEAITNAVKHGNRGRVYIGRTDDSVWMAVTDEGNGIESFVLPKAVLRRGYSTKGSLGLGYTIILEVADHILLHTGDTGTTVVLFKQIVEVEPSLDALPDTWSNIAI